MQVGSEFEVTTTAVVAGGVALARAEDGRVVFVEGALAPETVRVEVTEIRRDLLRARAVAVVTPAPERVDPPCPHHVEGCGGCPWQAVAVDAQPAMKAAIVADALRRIAHLEDMPIRSIALPAEGYRTTVRALVVDGRAAFRRRHAHDPITIDHCLVTHPLVDDLLVHGRFGNAHEVTLRAAVATGERLALADPVRAALDLPPDVAVGPKARVHEVIEGHTFRVSARSFFQARPDGAATLARTVRDAIGPERRVADLYAGVGLFGALLDRPRKVIAVEGSRSAAADAVENLAHVDAHVVHGDVRRWKPQPVDAVVADPGRTGLQKAGVQVITQCDPDTVVLVSCDAAALARDTKLLRDASYEVDQMTLIDIFGHTPHIEVVTKFVR
jgi:23S rRNA (uracil1939-C5)-methyltransferase